MTNKDILSYVHVVDKVSYMYLYIFLLYIWLYETLLTFLLYFLNFLDFLSKYANGEKAVAMHSGILGLNLSPTSTAIDLCRIGTVVAIL